MLIIPMMPVKPAFVPVFGNSFLAFGLPTGLTSCLASCFATGFTATFFPMLNSGFSNTGASLDVSNLNSGFSNTGAS